MSERRRLAVVASSIPVTLSTFHRELLRQLCAAGYEILVVSSPGAELDAMAADAGIALTELRVDGGAATNDTLMQFQADLLGVPVVRPAVTETTALGAAYLAGLAVGFWPSIDAITGQWRVDRRFEPNLPRQTAISLRTRWTAAVERSKGWDKL